MDRAFRYLLATQRTDGAWVPLSRLFPKADIPVVQISLPRPSDPQRLFKAGQALAGLRDHGVLFLGTGNITHNLRMARFGAKEAPTDAWALHARSDRAAAGDAGVHPHALRACRPLSDSAR